MSVRGARSRTLDRLARVLLAYFVLLVWLEISVLAGAGPVAWKPIVALAVPPGALGLGLWWRGEPGFFAKLPPLRKWLWSLPIKRKVSLGSVWAVPATSIVQVPGKPGSPDGIPVATGGKFFSTDHSLRTPISHAAYEELLARTGCFGLTFAMGVTLGTLLIVMRLSDSPAGGPNGRPSR